MTTLKPENSNLLSLSREYMERINKAVLIDFDTKISGMSIEKVWMDEYFFIKKPKHNIVKTYFDNRFDILLEILEYTEFKDEPTNPNPNVARKYWVLRINSDCEPRRFYSLSLAKFNANARFKEMTEGEIERRERELPNYGRF